MLGLLDRLLPAAMGSLDWREGFCQICAAVGLGFPQEEKSRRVLVDSPQWPGHLRPTLEHMRQVLVSTACSLDLDRFGASVGSRTHHKRKVDGKRQTNPHHIYYLARFQQSWMCLLSFKNNKISGDIDRNSPPDSWSTVMLSTSTFTHLCLERGLQEITQIFTILIQ